MSKLTPREYLVAASDALAMAGNLVRGAINTARCSNKVELDEEELEALESILLLTVLSLKGTSHMAHAKTGAPTNAYINSIWLKVREQFPDASYIVPSKESQAGSN